MSWAGLLIGMFFKYVVVQNEIGVQIFGPVRGAIFVGYVVVTLAATLDTCITFLALLASILPVGTVVFERWASRHRKLNLQVSTA